MTSRRTSLPSRSDGPYPSVAGTDDPHPLLRGRLIASTFSRLDALGETNTLAFFLSDNGYQWHEHGLDRKGKPYDDSVQIPFFVRWPGHIETGLVDERIVANIDIAPTVYDALDYVPNNYAPDGRSISALIEPSS